jgi:NAD(P)-dependent dehydrogenase (short-subunit alcohol dehydrogenase family)
LRDRNIRVNVISPGGTETPGINTLAGMPNPGPNAAEEFENDQRGIVPLARDATAEEVANAALFLASSAASSARSSTLRPATAAGVERTKERT